MGIVRPALPSWPGWIDAPRAYLLPEPWPPRAPCTRWFFHARMRAGLLGGLGQVPVGGEFGGHAPHQPRENARNRGEARPRLAQGGIQIGRTANLALQRMKAPLRGGVALQPVTAGIGPVMR